MKLKTTIQQRLNKGNNRYLIEQKNSLSKDNMQQKKLIKRNSSRSYLMSTMSSFAKKPLSSHKKQKQSINPQNVQSIFQMKSFLNTGQCLLRSSKKFQKISNYLDLLKQSNKIESKINQKLFTQTTQQWKQRYLKKRVKSIHKISVNIKEMNQIFNKNQLDNKKLTKNQLDNKRQTKNVRFNTMGFQSIQKRKVRLISQDNIKVRQNIEQIQNQLLQPIQQRAKPHVQQNRLKSKSVTHFKPLRLLTQPCTPQLPSNLPIQKPQKLKLQTQTIYSNKLKHKSKSINTLQSFQASIIQTNQQNQAIHEVRKLRIKQKVETQPKQWHFHNCLNLNKIQLYQTKLNVSAETWVALDHLELKFLRGCNPKEIKDFTPMIRLLVMKCFHNIQSQYQIKLNQILFRVHYKNLKNRVKMRDHFISDKTLDEEQGYSLRNHTIISVQDMLIGLNRTISYDYLYFLIYIAGYIMLLIEQLQSANEPISRIDNLVYNQVIYFKENYQLQRYISKFLQKSRMIISSLQLSSMQVHEQNFRLRLSSHPLDISKLFMSCLTYRLMSQIINCQVSFCVQIKYQIGWNHWERRKHTFQNGFKSIQNIGYWGYKDLVVSAGYHNRKEFGNKKEECVLVYSNTKKIILVLADAKINMAINDLLEMQKWILKTFKRFFKQRKAQDKLCKIQPKLAIVNSNSKLN